MSIQGLVMIKYGSNVFMDIPFMRISIIKSIVLDVQNVIQRAVNQK